mmetsp:Transcript_24728/g.58120  ORF Transcript_24728/g.58120 Transcript_24728/m.58120 type:complete len:265 (+) Transcript_24728:58-852(+)
MAGRPRRRGQRPWNKVKWSLWWIMGVLMLLMRSVLTMMMVWGLALMPMLVVWVAMVRVAVGIMFRLLLGRSLGRLLDKRNGINRLKGGRRRGDPVFRVGSRGVAQSFQLGGGVFGGYHCRRTGKASVLVVNRSTGSQPPNKAAQAFELGNSGVRDHRSLVGRLFRRPHLAGVQLALHANPMAQRSAAIMLVDFGTNVLMLLLVLAQEIEHGIPRCVKGIPHKANVFQILQSSLVHGRFGLSHAIDPPAQICNNSGERVRLEIDG